MLLHLAQCKKKEEEEEKRRRDGWGQGGRGRNSYSISHDCL